MSTSPTASPDTARRVVQRTILRPDQELDVRTLYVHGVSRFFASDDEGTGQAGADEKKDGRKKTEETEVVEGLQGFGSITDDGELVVEPTKRVTLGTYFNAFPASYWRRWTDVDSVRLRLRVRGTGNVVIYRSTARGHVVRAGSEVVTSEEPREVEVDLTLQPFIDGGWYWYDLEAEDGRLVLEEASWSVETDRQERGRVSVGITTFNRPDFCVDQLLRLGESAEVAEILDEVVVVDQGNQRVREHADFARAAELLGDRLNLVEQPNLGGSGGFSRAMSEAVSRGTSDYVLLLDDDVVCELQGLVRAVTFADVAREPVLVGGQMFSLYDRSVMHAFGETMAPWRWFWGPAPATKHGHNFARRSLRSTSWLHRRVDVDYNGWWMCLIPTRVIREIGLSMPMFIKWDDAEFGLRARAAGYPTVTLPGSAVWHVPWTEKDDTLDWQAYFHERNRIVTGLLHSPYDRGGRLVLESLENHAKRMVSMQYSTGEVILLALQDVLAGPERMHRDMSLRLQEVRELRTRYPDGQMKTDLAAFPPPKMKRPPKRGRDTGSVSSRLGVLTKAARGMVRQLSSPRELASEHPEALMPHVDQRWWRLASMDSAVVSTADGGSASWYQRDPQEFRQQMRRSASLHAELLREWPELARRYREAAAELTSPELWKQTFEGLEDQVGPGALPPRTGD
ncbi:glycosyltransferase [Nocardioides aequoreus]|uniref:glycosyltransferase n=1 Tax=Nocardioides aequoreus TaxID=397278 RepID=UPI00068FEADB|nr:glycosyltransferase [Nocardioides aequoreus]